MYVHTFLSTTPAAISVLPLSSRLSAFGAKMRRKAINPPRNAIRRIRHAGNDCERAYWSG
ncbi:hypothetical protein KCP75_19155 [Salmonella enterica subsp. enterica]|nr:hypothetical protein KCP75_19155 [Salmonella enterica subsp. enterica]